MRAAALVVGCVLAIAALAWYRGSERRAIRRQLGIRKLRGQFPDMEELVRDDDDPELLGRRPEQYGEVEIDPAVCGGKPCVAGLRFPLETIAKFLDAGETEGAILDAYPYLTPEDVRTADRSRALAILPPADREAPRRYPLDGMTEAPRYSLEAVTAARDHMRRGYPHDTDDELNRKVARWLYGDEAWPREYFTGDPGR